MWSLQYSKDSRLENKDYWKETQQNFVWRIIKSAMPQWVIGVDYLTTWYVGEPYQTNGVLWKKLTNLDNIKLLMW